MRENLKFEENTDYQALRRDFENYYEKDILPALKKAENVRKKYMMAFGIMSIFILIWLGFVWHKMEQGLASFKEGSGYYDFTGCLLTLIVCWPLFGYYRRSKENLLPLIAKFFGEFSYVYRPKLPLSLLKKSLLFKNKKEEIVADDCFNGSYKNLPTTIVEYITLKKQYRRDEKNRTDRFVYNKTGGGIIFYAKMNKKFSGQTITVADKGLFNKITRYKNLQRVGMESPEFEKAFEVYSDNQIEARYILTTIMLEYMVELKKNFPKIEFSFFNEHIFIKIETRKNMFECINFFRSVINKPQIEKIFTELYLLFSIIDTLHLNQQRIL